MTDFICCIYLFDIFVNSANWNTHKHFLSSSEELTPQTVLQLTQLTDFCWSHTKASTNSPCQAATSNFKKGRYWIQHQAWYCESSWSSWFSLMWNKINMIWIKHSAFHHNCYLWTTKTTNMNLTLFLKSISFNELSELHSFNSSF